MPHWRLIAKIFTAALLAAVLLTALRHWPDALGPAADLPVIAEPLDAWLASAEDRVNAESGLVAGAGKRIRWYANLPATQTEYALVGRGYATGESRAIGLTDATRTARTNATLPARRGS